MLRLYFRLQLQTLIRINYGIITNIHIKMAQNFIVILILIFMDILELTNINNLLDKIKD